MRAGPLTLRARIVCGDEFAIGPGKADLLEAIDRTGSISAAGRDLGMSYRRAWLLVDAMNRCWKDRVVETVAGGARERGARLTETGRAILASYRAMERAMATAAEADLAHLAAMVRAEPEQPRA